MQFPISLRVGMLHIWLLVLVLTPACCNCQGHNERLWSASSDAADPGVTQPPRLHECNTMLTSLSTSEPAIQRAVVTQGIKSAADAHHNTPLRSVMPATMATRFIAQRQETPIFWWNSLETEKVVRKDQYTTVGAPPIPIMPPAGPTTLPIQSSLQNTTLIQIGFKHVLNFAFVSSSGASNEIFEILPQALAYGLNCRAEDISMLSLVPYDTTSTQGFITTVALLYIPQTSVSKLTIQLPNRGSTLYKNPNATRATFMTKVDPSLPVPAIRGLTLGSGAESISPIAATAARGTSFNPTSTTSSVQHDAAPIASLSTGAIVGIVVSVITACAIVASITLLVIRRKRARASQTRISTIKNQTSFSNLHEADPCFQRAGEMDGHCTCEKDGDPRSEAPGRSPGPGFLPEMAVGGPDQGFIVEMPDTSRRSLEQDSENKPEKQAGAQSNSD